MAPVQGPLAEQAEFENAAQGADVRTCADRRTIAISEKTASFALLGSSEFDQQAPGDPDFRLDRTDRQALGRATTSAAAVWRLRSLTFAFADDYLGVPKNRLNDDNGFVANMRVTAEIADGDRGTLRLEASQQMITQRGGLRRVDEGKVYATRQRSSGSSAAKSLTVGWTVGADVIGNLGGSGLQNWAHQVLFRGRLLTGTGSDQLQYRYPDHYQVLAIVGGLLRADHRVVGPWSVKAGVEAEGRFGTGLFGELHPYVAIGLTTEFADLEFREAAGIYGTNIHVLSMPGGYVTGLLQSQPSATVSLVGPWSLPTIIILKFEWNRGDAHQHVGEIVLGTHF